MKGSIWLFEQEQALGFSSVSTNTRMTVIKLKSGGLWVHAPIAPTKECIQARTLSARSHSILLFLLPTSSAHPDAIGCSCSRSWTRRWSTSCCRPSRTSTKSSSGPSPGSSPRLRYGWRPGSGAGQSTCRSSSSGSSGPSRSKMRMTPRPGPSKSSRRCSALRKLVLSLQMFSIVSCSCLAAYISLWKSESNFAFRDWAVCGGGVLP